MTTSRATPDIARPDDGSSATGRAESRWTANADNAYRTLRSQCRQLLQIVLLTANIVSAFLFSTSGVIGQDLRAEKVHGWDFQRGDDRNLDRQPDGWRRRRDRQHPFYITSQIVSRDLQKARRANQEQMFIAKLMHAAKIGKWDDDYVPEAIPDTLESVMDRYVFENCLEIRMDGGAAELVSPTFPIDPRFSYSLQAEIETEGLDGHRAWIELQLLDAQQRPVEVLETERTSQTTPWHTLATPIGTSQDDNLRWGRVHIKIEPHGELLINGTARIDEIEIYRLPRLTLATTLPYQIATPGANFAVECLAIGIPKWSSNVRFELRNHLYELMASESVQLTSIEKPKFQPAREMQPGKSPGSSGERLVSKERKPTLAAESAAATTSVTAAAEQRLNEHFYDGVAEWLLQLDSPGLYYVSVVLGSGDNAQRRELKIGVMHPRERISAGPFGWSIKQFDDRLAPEQVPALVSRFGAGWVKYPVWFDENETIHADQIVAMTERLQLIGARCVGKIDQPPASQRSIFGEGTNRLPAITIFRDPRAWEPVLDPVLTRMGLKLEWFQLGGDDDHSFQNQVNFTELLGDVRTRMQTYSQELKIALCWRWESSPGDVASTKPWNAIQLTAEPQLTSAELLNHAESLGQARRSGWVQLNPLPASKYSLLDRVRDLTERMIVVKRADLPAAFMVDPFNAEYGVMEHELTVSEMLLPWTNLVEALGDKDYIGSITMPSGSTNHCFQSDRESVMIVWNDTPTVEQLFLGNEISAFDVWGAPVDATEVVAANGFREQRLSVGNWPLIIRGIDAAIVRWRQQFRVEVANLSSMIVGRRTLPIELTNALPQSATGSLSLHSDSLLGATDASMPLQLATGSRGSLNMPLQLRPDASAGKHDLRFDVAVNAGEPYQFSIYRTISLGSGDIEFRWEHNRKSDSEVELRIELINNTAKETSFDCRYFPIGRPYQRFQIVGARPGTTLHEVTIRVTEEDFQNGAWIRCEEIGANRVLNYRIEL